MFDYTEYSQCAFDLNDNPMQFDKSFQVRLAKIQK